MSKTKASPASRDSEIARRKRLTFEQAEGTEDLPRQLAKEEVSDEMRAYLWSVIVTDMQGSIYRDRITGGAFLVDPWNTIMRDNHVLREFGMVDEYTNEPQETMTKVKRLIQRGDYTDIFGFIQWVLRHASCPAGFPDAIAVALQETRSAYELCDGDTIIPISSDEEAATFKQALAATAEQGLPGPRKHLKQAAQEMTNGNWASSIRESIHAVESSAKVLVPSANTLDPALAILEKKGILHGALRSGFASLYGFTSDEEGIRHSLLDKEDAKVDETDAQYMLGACAAFVSYLLARARNRN